MKHISYKLRFWRWARNHEHGYWQYDGKNKQILCIACASVFKIF